MLLDIRDKLQTATLASWFLQYSITGRNFRLGLRRALRQTRHPPHSSHRWFRAWSTDRDSRKASSIVMSKKKLCNWKIEWKLKQVECWLRFGFQMAGSALFFRSHILRSCFMTGDAGDVKRNERLSSWFSFEAFLKFKFELPSCSVYKLQVSFSFISRSHWIIVAWQWAYIKMEILARDRRFVCPPKPSTKQSSYREARVNARKFVICYVNVMSACLLKCSSRRPAPFLHKHE